MQIKDPLQIKYYEDLLGRKLTETEKNGECEVTINGYTFFLELTTLNFPYDLMDSVTLASMGKKPRDFYEN